MTADPPPSLWHSHRLQNNACPCDWTVSEGRSQRWHGWAGFQLRGGGGGWGVDTDLWLDPHK